MCFVNPDLRLAALLLCIIFFFAKRSISETTEGNIACASFLSSSSRNFLIAFLVVYGNLAFIYWCVGRERKLSKKSSEFGNDNVDFLLVNEE